MRFAPLVIFPKCFRRFDVAILRAFITTTKEDNNGFAFEADVDTVAWTNKEPQLRDTISDQAMVSKVS
jgi:hypothetical protein